MKELNGMHGKIIIFNVLSENLECDLKIKKLKKIYRKLNIIIFKTLKFIILKIFFGQISAKKPQIFFMLEETRANKGKMFWNRISDFRCYNLSVTCIFSDNSIFEFIFYIDMQL